MLPAAVEDPGMAAATAEGVEMLGGASVEGEAGMAVCAGAGRLGLGRAEEEALGPVSVGRPVRGAAVTLVERWMMSLPWT